MTEAGAVGFYREDAFRWEKVLCAFLIEKERRSGSWQDGGRVPLDAEARDHP